MLVVIIYPTQNSWAYIPQAAMFGWMLNLTSFGASAIRPGFMATILAPNDDAVWYLLNQKGNNRISLEKQMPEITAPHLQAIKARGLSRATPRLRHGKAVPYRYYSYYQA